MDAGFLVNIIWITAAGILGFLISFLFAGKMHLSRRVFLLPYLVLAGTFLYAFFSWNSVQLADLIKHNLVWGLAGAVIFGTFTIRSIFMQPKSNHIKGPTLVWDIFWLGLVYGALDALYLSVMPVLAIWQAFSSFDWSGTLWGKILIGIIALIASLLVTNAYHFGYPEYRTQGKFVGPSIGNGAMSLGYILTVNPLVAILSHIGMHIAGVFHGPETVMQLPPHSR